MDLFKWDMTAKYYTSVGHTNPVWIYCNLGDMTGLEDLLAEVKRCHVVADELRSWQTRLHTPTPFKLSSPIRVSLCPTEKPNWVTRTHKKKGRTPCFPSINPPTPGPSVFPLETGLTWARRAGRQYWPGKRGCCVACWQLWRTHMEPSRWPWTRETG